MYIALCFFVISAFLLPCTRSVSPKWTQTAILSAGDRGDAFGWASTLSADGSLLVVGSAGAGNGVGALYSYKRVSGSWQLTSTFKPLPNETFGGSAFGASLALSHDSQTLLSGVYTSYESEGGVAIFSALPGQPGCWTLAQLIEAPLPGDQFGASSSLSADAQTLAVGATYANGGAGAVSMYLRSNSSSGSGGGSYVLTQILLPPATAGAVSGLGASAALAADGSLLATGAASGGSGAGGAVLIFASGNDNSGGNGLAFVQVLSPDVSAADDGFGDALALDTSARRLVVGAAGLGVAYVFMRGSGGGGDLWTQTQVLALGGEGASSALGWDVALAASGSVAIVGANDAGAVPVPAYIADAAGNFSLAQSLAPVPALPPGAYFGWSASLSSTGAVLAVGAEGGGEAGQGAVYIFEAEGVV